MESAQCRLEVAKVPMPQARDLSDSLANAAISGATFDNCMVAKGWEKSSSR